MKSKKVAVAKLSVLSNSILITIKIVAGFLTGSVSIISEAIHSSMDLLASFIALISVKVSANPPDKNHPFGHEKAENVSGVVEAVLVMFAASLIVYFSVKKLLGTVSIELELVGFAVMSISAIANFIIAAKLYKVAKDEDSVAIEADALHLKTDALSSLTVALGLGLIWLTGLKWLDPVVAIIVALIIFWEGFVILLHSFGPLMDEQLTDDEMDKLRAVLAKHEISFVDFHDLRTRKAGSVRHIDLHMTVPSTMSVAQSHEITELIEKSISQEIANSKVLVHIEPCDKLCKVCKFVLNCVYKK
ncbi:MAG: cation diffusion facilitator family transporter [Endomicrobiales bacterium]|jgi:cation diffusion facilitator family transporter|nr:cation diffusion facilitator family transporter [Endomicrobiales bacterium]